MSLITCKEAATILHVDTHKFDEKMKNLGIEVMEGPKFGRGRMTFIRESDLEEARKRLEELREKKREHLAKAGAGTRIVSSQPIHEKLDQINQKLDRLLMMWTNNG